MVEHELHSRRSDRHVSYLADGRTRRLIPPLRSSHAQLRSPAIALRGVIVAALVSHNFFLSTRCRFPGDAVSRGSISEPWRCSNQMETCAAAPWHSDHFRKVFFPEDDAVYTPLLAASLPGIKPGLQLFRHGVYGVVFGTLRIPWTARFRPRPNALVRTAQHALGREYAFAMAFICLLHRYLLTEDGWAWSLPSRLCACLLWSRSAQVRHGGA